MRVWVLLLFGACSFRTNPVTGDGGVDGDAGIDTPIDAPGCGVAEIAATGNHTCARMFDGTVSCWGNDSTYELGSVATMKCTIGTMMYACSATPVPVAVTGATALGLGTSHSCAATASGAYCWGFNKYGAFGDGTTTTSASPKPIAQRGTATLLAGGVYHTCSIAGGQVSCSGQNVAGEVGNNTSMTQTTAVPVLSDATALAAGEYISCAINSSQQLYCWGSNTYREIDATAQPRLVPTVVAGIASAIRVAAGRDHICAVSPDHHLTCKGNGAQGQLATGVLAGIVDVSANHNHTCVRDEAGSVSCFGEQYGATQVPISLRRPAIALASGPYHDCALTDDHAVWCWGDNSFGELGNGMAMAARITTPQHVPLCP